MRDQLWVFDAKVSRCTNDCEATPPPDLLIRKQPIDIFKVDGASVKDYVDVYCKINGANLAYLLLAVPNLPFEMLILINILRPHAATLSIW